MSRSVVHESAYSCCPVALPREDWGHLRSKRHQRWAPDDANMVDWQKNTGTNEKPLTIIDLHRERVREYERVRVRVIESQQEPEQVRDKSSK